MEKQINADLLRKIIESSDESEKIKAGKLILKQKPTIEDLIVMRQFMKNREVLKEVNRQISIFNSVLKKIK